MEAMKTVQKSIMMMTMEAMQKSMKTVQASIPSIVAAMVQKEVEHLKSSVDKSTQSIQTRQTSMEAMQAPGNIDCAGTISSSAETLSRTELWSKVEHLKSSVDKNTQSIQTLQTSMESVTMKTMQESIQTVQASIPSIVAAMVQKEMESVINPLTRVNRDISRNTQKIAVARQASRSSVIESRKRKRKPSSTSTKENTFVKGSQLYNLCQFCETRNHVRSKKCKNSQCGKMGWRK